MRPVRAWSLPLLFLLLLVPVPAGAQQRVTSARPDRVAVTVYRAPHRNAEEAFDLEWLDGYALISETRRITIPAGESEIRFEGVAGGIVPQSTIVSGLPDNIVERNRDAMLLSPGSLLDRSLGQRVHLRRTSNATGAVTEQDAIIRSGANGAVVLQTAQGFEALRCTGLPETIHYDGVPAGLSAQPTLSVRARSREPVTATVTLAYLANGFDWQANYIANLSPDGSHVELFAWLTLASSDDTSFANANTQAVAGRINRAAVDVDAPEAAPLNLTCWPQGRTHEISPENPGEAAIAGVINMTTNVGDTLNDLPQLRTEFSQSVVVSGTAIQEELGDLKLYRIPEPVTVAAHSQKQVAFLQQPNVQVSLVYRQHLQPDDTGVADPARRVLVTRNRTEEGLGLPLPAGGVQLFAEGRGRPILLGEGSLRDRAIGEDVEIEIGEAPGVRTTLADDEAAGKEDRYILTVTNDQAAPARYEMEFVPDDGDEVRASGARLGRRNGHPLWAVTIPANGSATLRYRLHRAES